jgi:hypothetical protein
MAAVLSYAWTRLDVQVQAQKERITKRMEVRKRLLVIPHVPGRRPRTAQSDEAFKDRGRDMLQHIVGLDKQFSAALKLPMDVSRARGCAVAARRHSRPTPGGADDSGVPRRAAMDTQRTLKPALARVRMQYAPRCSVQPARLALLAPCKSTQTSVAGLGSTAA